MLSGFLGEIPLLQHFATDLHDDAKNRWYCSNNVE